MMSLENTLASYIVAGWNTPRFALVIITICCYRQPVTVFNQCRHGYIYESMMPTVEYILLISFMIFRYVLICASSYTLLSCDERVDMKSNFSAVKLVDEPQAFPSPSTL